MTTPIDRTAELERIYMLEPSEPSELWTEAAQSPLSPEVLEEIECAREARSSAKMLGWVLIADIVVIALGVWWLVWYLG